MNQDNFLTILAARRRFGMRPGLDRIRGVLARLGNPEDGIPCVHIAGTNGKGAVAAMTDAILRAAGCRVFRYTSPHLVRLNERFFADGAPVSDARLADAAARVCAAVAEEEAASGAEVTFFEALTAVAFELFRALRAESPGPARWVAVLETGLGGRLDATNVVARPLASVITRIGLDHTDWLGETHAAIAGEKSGIVKPGCPVVSGAMPADAEEVVARAAARAGSLYVRAPEAVRVEIEEARADGQRLRASTAAGALPPIDLPLAGAFQAENAQTALAAADVLRRVHGFDIPDGALARGLKSVVWPGRCQLVRRGGAEVLVDGAHNPDGARALRAAALAARGARPACLLAGYCADKDIDAHLRTLADAAGCAIAVPIRNARSLAPEETAARMRAAGFAEVAACATLAEGLARGLAWSRATGGLLVACGSLFLAGEVLGLLDAFPWASDKPFPNEMLKSGGWRE